MKIENGLLIDKVHSPERSVSIPCQEITIDTIDQEIAVRWKNAWHRKRTNEVGDGMEVLRVHDRKEFDFEIDPVHFLYGLSPWQEYDEHTNEVKTYLYKFPKNPENLEMVNNLIKELLPAVSLQVAGRFVVLSGADSGLINPNDMLQISKNTDIQQIISFFCGLLLAYGETKIEDGILHNCSIRIPLTGPIGMWSELLHTYLNVLTSEGVYTTQSLLVQRDGQLLQITISDREFLTIVSQLLRQSYGIIEVSKFNTHQQQKQHLLKFLSEQRVPVEVVSMVQHSVLKTVRK